MTVGDVMDQLAYGPAAFAIGTIELRVVQAFDRRAKALGKMAQRFDMCSANAWKRGCGRIEAADGIAKIVQVCHGADLSEMQRANGPR